MSARVVSPPGLKRRIVLMGPPASGKGTQAELIRTRYGYPVTSPGAMLREEKRRGTQLGVSADELTRDGFLLPDEIVIQLVANWLAQHGNQFIFDGFPRSLRQAEVLETILARRGLKLEIALALEADAETLQARVASRLICQECGLIVAVGLHVEEPTAACPRCRGPLARRADDNPETLLTRLREYREKTEPLLGYYGERGLLQRIDSARPPSEVFASVRKALGDDT